MLSAKIKPQILPAPVSINFISLVFKIRDNRATTANDIPKKAIQTVCILLITILFLI